VQSALTSTLPWQQAVAAFKLVLEFNMGEPCCPASTTYVAPLERACYSRFRPACLNV
jgi:hypothetical protein